MSIRHFIRRGLRVATDPRVRFSEQFWYGNREVLRFAWDLPHGTLFLGQLQHGWTSPRFLKLWAKQDRTFATKKLVWSEQQANELREFGLNATAVGAPWLHLIGAANGTSKGRNQLSSEKQEASVYFPSHSVLHGGRPHSHARHLRLKHPSVTTVCLYWLDFIDPRIRDHYGNAGFNVECVGFRGGSRYEHPWVNSGSRIRFQINLLELLSRFSTVVVDEPSSIVWFAAASGASIEFVDPPRASPKTFSSLETESDDKWNYFLQLLGSGDRRDLIGQRLQLGEVALAELGAGQWSNSKPHERLVDRRFMPELSILDQEFESAIIDG